MCFCSLEICMYDCVFFCDYYVSCCLVSFSLEDNFFGIFCNLSSHLMRFHHKNNMTRGPVHFRASFLGQHL